MVIIKRVAFLLLFLSVNSSYPLPRIQRNPIKKTTPAIKNVAKTTNPAVKTTNPAQNDKEAKERAQRAQEFDDLGKKLREKSYDKDGKFNVLDQNAQKAIFTAAQKRIQEEKAAKEKESEQELKAIEKLMKYVGFSLMTLATLKFLFVMD